MKKNRIIINGQFTNRKMTGQERFAYEILSSLDRICKKNEFQLIVPINAWNIPKLENISVIRFGKAKGSLWEQIFLGYYTIRHNALSLNLCSVMPLVKPGIICIHDLSYKVNPSYFTTLYAKISQLWHKLQFHFAWMFSPLIFTVSEFSKKQMNSIYNVDISKIKVIGNGWEHFERIEENPSLLNQYKAVSDKEYFFSLGSLAPNKNIGWVLKIAQKHPQYDFYIAGKSDLKSYGIDYKGCDNSNVHFLGYISDEEIKSFMRHCKAFIFPSYYEGFGIPPLEALSIGTKVVAAKTSCLPEIFGNSVYWIDPYDTNVDLDVLLKEKVEDSAHILEKYKFERFAELLYNEIIKLKY